MNVANRVLWALLGLILLAAGVLGVLASLDLLGWIDDSTAVLPNSLDARWSRWGFWAPLLSIVVGVVLVVLGITLLRVETRRRGGRALPELVVGGPDGQPVAGMTRVDSHTLVHALTSDLVRDNHIDSASANLTGTTEEPKLRLRLAVIPGADLSRLHDFVDGALDRFATTTGLRPRVTDVEVRLTNEPMSRVR